MAQAETQLQAEEKAARDSGAAAAAIGAPRQHRVMSSLANTTGSDDAAGVADAIGGKGSASSGASAGANLAGVKGGDKNGEADKTRWVDDESNGSRESRVRWAPR